MNGDAAILPCDEVIKQEVPGAMQICDSRIYGSPIPHFKVGDKHMTTETAIKSLGSKFGPYWSNEVQVEWE